MRFRFSILMLIFLVTGCSSALAEELSFTYAPEIINPGKAERIMLQAPVDEELTLEIQDANQQSIQTLRDHIRITQNPVTVIYNGLSGGEPLPQGAYIFQAQAGEQTVSHPFTVGEAAPSILVSAGTPVRGREDVSFTLDVTSSKNGLLNALLISPEGEAQPLLSVPVQEGSNTVRAEGVKIDISGDYTLSITVTDDNGVSSNSYQLSLALTAPATPKPQPTIRPSTQAEETVTGDYWSMEVGNYDWEAIWQVMIAPMTIVEGTGKQAERQTYKLRAAPDGKSEAIGLITCQTQGVHVLETLDNGWTRVETYNSSYGEAYSDAGKGAGYGQTAALVQGYVETDRLGTFTPRTEYGLLIDKMTQELYIVNEKGLVSTLLVSTGFATSSQPWNETPAGEYYLSSKVGDFPSGNLICQYGMRFNNGDILHQVPYIYNEKYDLKDFSACEKYLGEKASHGCVRVQRKANADGVNMKWIWDNVPTKTKLIIWEDSGRPEPFMEYPVPADTVLYYNPNGGQYYHADQNCSSIKARFLPLPGSMTYAELDDPAFAALTPCKHCKPPALRMSQIDEINTQNGYW